MKQSFLQPTGLSGDMMTDRLHCIKAGSRSSPTVVLLHGFAGSAEVWRGVIEQIKDSAHILAFDLPGHAGSLAFPNFGSPRIAAVAVAQEMKLRGIERYHIAGHSMGGAVASLIALSEPQSVASLTLLAPGGFGKEINFDIMQALASAKSIDELRSCMETMSGQGAAVSETGLSQAAAMRAADGQLDALALVLSKIVRDGFQGELPLDALAALQIPTHVVWGSGDPVVPVNQLTAAPAQFMKTIWPNLGHMLIDEAPDRVADAILQALK
ncbi:MAG: alpha/beta fold hydrolase [Rhizobiaceae bacterium]